MTDFDMQARRLLLEYSRQNESVDVLMGNVAAALKAAYNEGLEDAALWVEPTKEAAATFRNAPDYDPYLSELVIKLHHHLRAAVAEQLRAKKVPA